MICVLAQYNNSTMESYNLLHNNMRNETAVGLDPGPCSFEVSSLVICDELRFHFLKSPLTLTVHEVSDGLASAVVIRFGACPTFP